MPGEVRIMRELRCRCGRKLMMYRLIEGEIEVQCPDSRCKMLHKVTSERPAEAQ